MSTAREMEKRKSRPFEWDGAPRGLIKNAPHADLPRGSVAGITNAINFPTEWRPRNGTRIVDCPPPPELKGRSGYIAEKVGNLITATTDIFTPADISRYWVWPGNPRQHDEIQVYVNSRQVRVGTHGDKDLTAGCWMHSRLNLFKFHKTARRVVFQWGTDIYVAGIETSSNGYVEIVDRERCVCVSRDAPWDVESTWDERDRFGVVFNPGGTFIVDFDNRVVHKANTPVPQTLLESNTTGENRLRRFSYTYAMARISGSGIRDRRTPGAMIVQQSGSTKLRGDEGFERDYADIWAERPIGDSTRTTGRLVGQPIVVGAQDPAFWTGLGEAGGSLQVNINDTQCEFNIDFSVSGYNVTSVSQVADAIQKEMRSVFPFATCDYDDILNQFVITAGAVDGSTMGYVLDGTSGTNIAGAMLLREADGAELDNEYAYERASEVGLFAVPHRETAAGIETAIRERHWTHYVIIRSEDIGTKGVNPRVNELTGELLNPVFMSWVADLRVAAAFWAQRVNGIIAASHGEFEPADVGSSFEWEDGEIDTLGEYIDNHRMAVRGWDSLYDDDKEFQAAAIGGGHVVRGSQTGDVITREDLGDFDDVSVGDTIWTADGAELIVIARVAYNAVQVNISGTRPTMGFTFAPVSRMFNDAVADETLRARQGEPIVGFWEYRFYNRMPNCGIGVVVPGFVITARENDSKLHYCQQRLSEKYMLGYYLPNRQVNDRISGSITAIRKTPNKFLVFCRDSTWGGSTNMSDSNIKKMPQLGQSYAVLYADVMNERIGVVDVGSIASVADGIFLMRCSDGSYRMFDSTTYSDDMTLDPETRQDRIRKDFGEAWPQSASIYSSRGNLGHILWVKKKPE
jgi:hypothetical protein